MNKEAKDGINIDVGTGKSTVKFNNFDKVAVGKFHKHSDSSINIDMFPGRTHKPTVTMHKQRNFGWGKFSDSEGEEPEVKVITKTIIKEVPIFIKTPANKPIVRTEYIKTPAPAPVIITEQKPQAEPIVIESDPIVIKEPVPIIVEKIIPAPEPSPPEDINIEIEQPAMPAPPVIDVDVEIPAPAKPCPIDIDVDV